MESLEEQIEYLRTMKDYSDEEGPAKAKEEVIVKVPAEVEKMKQYVLKKLKIELGIPHLGSCGTDSLDAYWKEDGKYTILLNIRLEELSAYYGESEDNTKYWEIEGKLK